MKKIIYYLFLTFSLFSSNAIAQPLPSIWYCPYPLDAITPSTIKFHGTLGANNAGIRLPTNTTTTIINITNKHGAILWFHMTFMGTSTDWNSLEGLFLDIIPDEDYNNYFYATLDSMLYFYSVGWPLNNGASQGLGVKAVWWGDYPWDGQSWRMLSVVWTLRIPFRKSLRIRVANLSETFVSRCNFIGLIYEYPL
jgi:hypothetical protein